VKSCKVLHHEGVPRILACDDDPLIRRLLRTALERGGYEVVTAADGADAIAVLNEGHSFDALITDYNMPRANGIDVINHLHTIDPALPCIIITAFRDLDLAMRAMQAGAMGFVPKPFKTDYLLTVVSRACERRALEAETIRLRLLTPMLERFTMVLANTLESKDIFTQRHSERLVELAEKIGLRLELSETARSSLRLGACLHDIGKVGVPEMILKKPGGLTAGEFEVVKQHPVIGAAILEEVDAWEDVRLIVRHHHEHFDGGGYPEGLAGSEIPLGARIVNVVDSFDVMYRGRPYCRAKPLDAILHELQTLRGKQFDPEVVDVFTACLGDIDLTPTAADAASDNLTPHWLTHDIVPEIKTTGRPV
jgi:putative two-component system response regulator